MAKTLEELAKEIFDECEKDGEPITKEESLEMAQMEMKAKVEGKHYEQNQKKRKKRTVERKIDELKGQILSALRPTIEEFGEVTFQKTETEIDFLVDDIPYTLKLTKHKKDWKRK